MSRRLTFAVSTNNREILESNLLASACFHEPHPHQILAQEGFPSAAKAYNNAIDRSENDLIVCAHQDLIFPDSWLVQLEKALEYLASTDPNWGVLGCYGRTRDDGDRGYIYSLGLGMLGGPFEYPSAIQTLDEIVLIFRKSSGLRFDETLPDFHMYGVDICMAAAKRGMTNYAIPAFCIHNTTFNLVLPKAFYDCYKHVRRTWKEFLPIQTSCIRITESGLPMYSRKLTEFYLRHIRHKKVGATRATDVPQLLKRVQATHQGA